MRGKIALVTGASRGIGTSIARMLAGAGATVIITGIDQSELDATVRILASENLDVHGELCDVRSDEEQAELVKEIIRKFHKLDVLICNAGITGHHGPHALVGADDFDSVMATNLRSVVFLTNVAHPYLVKSTGSVVLISSIAGVRGNGTIGNYALAKAALTQLARNLAVQWGPQGIRVNCIAPGFIATEFAKPLLQDHDFMARRLAMTPLRRVGQPEEIAAAALFFASAASSFITGQQLIVDGGTTITDGS